MRMLDGKPKLLFIEACRGRESNFSSLVMTKSGSLPHQMGISLPRKQDVFVGFATVPGFVSYTSSKGLTTIKRYIFQLKRKQHR